MPFPNVDAEVSELSVVELAVVVAGIVFIKSPMTSRIVSTGVLAFFILSPFSLVNLVARMHFMIEHAEYKIFLKLNPIRMFKLVF